MASAKGMLIVLDDELRESCCKMIRHTLHMEDHQVLLVYDMTLTKTKHDRYHLRAKLRIGAETNNPSPWFNFQLHFGDFK